MNNIRKYSTLISWCIKIYFLLILFFHFYLWIYEVFLTRLLLVILPLQKGHKFLPYLCQVIIHFLQQLQLLIKKI